MSNMETTFVTPLFSESLTFESHIKSLPTKKRKFESSEKPMFFGRDPSYPPELNSLIQPLYCSLCNAQLNSIKTARVHYESKPHDKKITTWFNKWSAQTGEAIPEIKTYVKNGPTGVDALHCEICDLPLTSLQHAGQHYNGRKHRMVTAKIRDPSGSGFYNSEGKWVRQVTKPIQDNSFRFGIGNSLIKCEKVPKIHEKIQDMSQYCSLCNISVTSSQQMQIHVKGTKHSKKLKQVQQQPFAETILECITSSKNNDISMYRTPSGNYYCKNCNFTLTDITIFEQHLSSKKHYKVVKEKSIKQQNRKE